MFVAPCFSVFFAANLTFWPHDDLSFSFAFVSSLCCTEYGKRLHYTWISLNIMCLRESLTVSIATQMSSCVVEWWCVCRLPLFGCWYRFVLCVYIYQHLHAVDRVSSVFWSWSGFCQPCKRERLRKNLKKPLLLNPISFLTLLHFQIKRFSVSFQHCPQWPDTNP